MVKEARAELGNNCHSPLFQMSYRTVLDRSHGTGTVLQHRIIHFHREINWNRSRISGRTIDWTGRGSAQRRSNTARMGPSGGIYEARKAVGLTLPSRV